MPTPSKLGIIGNAFVRLGHKPPQSLNDTSAQATLAAQIYDEVVQTELASNPWSFALAQLSPPQLASYTNDFTSKYDYAYELTNDVIRVIGLQSRNEYMVSENRELWTNDSSPEIWYIKDVPVQQFQPWFVSSVVAQLAAAFSLSITGDNSRTEFFSRMAEDKSIAARNIDSQHVSPKFLQYMDLIWAESDVLF